jgi:hypothetical protein
MFTYGAPKHAIHFSLHRRRRNRFAIRWVRRRSQAEEFRRSIWRSIFRRAFDLGFT